ncbi:MFS transporter [Paraburkholderia sp.]|uniref:MFS transporter n=1 Tax=Paraburkholderia sp. TaxID=1926495 RepID=UPI003C5D99B9
MDMDIQESIPPRLLGATVDGNQIKRLLDLVPISSRHKRFVFAVSGALFLDLFDMVIAGSVVGALLAHKWLTLDQGAIFMSATSIGGAAGNFIGGIAADRYGRRPLLRTCLVIVGIFSLLCATARSPELLIGYRFLAAFGIGALPTIGALMMIETLPSRSRVRWVCYGGAIGNTSIIFVGLLGYWLLPIDGWRWMFVIPGIACIVFAACSGRIPESPRWLLAVGRTAEAEKTARYFGASEENSFFSQDSKALYQGGNSGNVQKAESVPIGRSSLVYRLALAIVITVCANMASNATVSWLPTMLISKGMSVRGSLGYNLLISIGAPIGTLLAALLSDRIPRRRTIAAAAATCMCLTILFISTGEGISALAFGFGSILTNSFIFNIAIGVYIHELFPTTIRGRAVSVAVSTSRLGLILLPFLMSWLIKHYGGLTPMWVVAALMASLSIAITLFGWETSNKPLNI